MHFRACFRNYVRASLLMHLRRCASRAERAFLRTVRFSSAARLLSLIPESLQRVHRSEGELVPSKTVNKETACSTSLWDGWKDAASQAATNEYEDEEEDDLDLAAMGL